MYNTPTYQNKVISKGLLCNFIRKLISKCVFTREPYSSQISSLSIVNLHLSADCMFHCCTQGKNLPLPFHWAGDAILQRMLCLTYSKNANWWWVKHTLTVIHNVYQSQEQGNKCAQHAYKGLPFAIIPRFQELQLSIQIAVAIQDHISSQWLLCLLFALAQCWGGGAAARRTNKKQSMVCRSFWLLETALP